jgi:hypothetical protein
MSDIRIIYRIVLEKLTKLYPAINAFPLLRQQGKGHCFDNYIRLLYSPFSTFRN